MYRWRIKKNRFVFLLVLLCVATFLENRCSGDQHTFTSTYSPLPQDHNVSIAFFSNQSSDNLTLCFQEAIEKAQSSIVLVAYSLTDPSIIRALAAKTDQGVKVFVVQDQLASRPIHQKIGARAQCYQVRRKGLLHLKLLAIDEKVVWLGSCNFTRDSFRLNANTVVRIVSPDLARLVEHKAKQLALSTPFPFPPFHQKIEGQSVQLYFLPEHPEALNRLIELIQSAKQQIRVAMYTFTHSLLAKALIEAHQRGVDVTVFLDEESSHGSSSRIYHNLLRHQVKTYPVKRKGLLHHKMVCIDEKVVALGSANWTLSAFKNNDDCLMIIDHLNEDQLNKLNAVWQTISQESYFSSRRRS